MTEALRLGIRYMFDEMHLHRISANYMPHNTPSAAVLKRLGFTVEGYARDYLQIEGRWQDHILTSLLESRLESAVTLDDLDGVVAAPGNHVVLFENDRVRVLKTTIPAGTVTPLHTHLTPTLQYVLSGSHFIRRGEDGETMFDTRADPDFVLPQVQFAEPSRGTRSRTPATTTSS